MRLCLRAVAARSSRSHAFLAPDLSSPLIRSSSLLPPTNSSAHIYKCHSQQRFYSAEPTSPSAPTKPEKVKLVRKDFENMHGEVFFTLLADPLSQFVENRQWSDVAPLLSTYQRYFFAFMYSDEAIATLGGFLPYAHLGRGEVFDDFMAFLRHIGDMEMQMIVQTAVRTLEEPHRWQRFEELRQQKDEKFDVPSALMHDEVLKSAFAPLNESYMRARPRTLERLEAFLRRHADEFVVIQ